MADQQELRKAMKRVFDSEDGKVILKHLSSCYFLNATTMSNSPEETAYKEGARSVVIGIINLLGSEPEFKGEPEPLFDPLDYLARNNDGP